MPPGLGTIEIKAMKDHGYTTEFAVGVTAASATLGPIIPPSLPFVIYGMMANVSIGALFLGGVIPGVVMTLLMMATVAFFAHRNGWGSDTPFSWAQLGNAGLEVVIVMAFPFAVWLMMRAGLSTNVAIGIALVVLLALDWYFDFSAVMALMTPVILIGGMTLGLFTPTEAAVAAVLWSLFLGLVRYRSMTMRTLAKATFDTIETTASVLFIVTAASIFAWLLTASQAAQILSDLDPRPDPEQVGLPAAGEPADPVRRLLPRHDRRDHHPGADPAADRAQARHRSDPFRADHHAQPDDRPAAPAAGHGAVRAGAGGKTLGRADHHGHPALARAALPGPDRDHLLPSADPLAAQGCGLRSACHSRFGTNAQSLRRGSVTRSEQVQHLDAALAALGQDRLGGGVDRRLVDAAQHEAGAEAALAHERVAADLDRGWLGLDLAQRLRDLALGADHGDRARAARSAPPFSRGFRPANIACRIEGTPGRTWTLPMVKPGATLTGLSISSAPSGVSAIFIRAGLTFSGG